MFILLNSYRMIQDVKRKPGRWFYGLNISDGGGFGKGVFLQDLMIILKSMAVKKKPARGGEAFYIQQCVKMCPYPVNIIEGTIDVPQNELEDLDLGTLHLQSLGFRIQSCIPGTVEKREAFDPKIRLTPRVVERARSEFLNGDSFSVGSSGEVLRITHIERGKIHLAYDAPKDVRLRQKAPLLVSEEQLKHALGREIWKRIDESDTDFRK